MVGEPGRTTRLVREMGHGSSSGTRPSTSGSSAGSSTHRTTASTGTSTSNGDRVAYHWIGEPGEKRTITYADLHEEVCKLANALKDLGVAQGRSRRDLSADDPRAAGRDARLRPDRRRALGRVRRLLQRVAAGSHQRRRVQGPDHRRRRLSARRDRATEGQRGRGPGGTRLDREGGRRAADQRGRRLVEGRDVDYAT